MTKHDMTMRDFFEIGPEAAYGAFSGCSLPWEPLHHLKTFIEDFLKKNGTRIPSNIPKDVILQGDVYIEDDVLIESGTFIAGPTLIFKGAEVRFGGYIRGQVVVAEKAVVGHDSEIKHSLLLPGAKAAHFAYVGDSILGRNVNLGAGTKLANLKVDMGKASVKIRVGDTVHDTGLRKIGAVFGDNSSVGCNTVTNPGTLIGRETLGYAVSSLSGYYPPHSIIKNKPNVVVVPRRS